MDNKRRNQRVVPLPLETVEVQIMGDGFLEIASAQDIGVSGVGINVPQGFEELKIIGEVELIITIPNVESFKARGIIKHGSPFGDKGEGAFLGIFPGFPKAISFCCKIR